jgi:hypothetical protein
VDEDRVPGSRMKHRIGMSRRDLLRRGAIVGGTLLWTIPVIKTISSAHVAPGSPTFTCCECRAGNAGELKTTGNVFECTDDGSIANEQACLEHCAARKAGERAYNFHSGPVLISCNGDNVCVGQGH